MMSPVPIYQVDAFTAHPFSGNPAAVCLLTQEPPADWMQAVAAEMNLAETAFLWPLDTGFALRWFTPLVEVDLCGHATLAAAHVLWETGRGPSDAALHFSTRSGWLQATRDGDAIRLDFPQSVLRRVEPPADLAGALGATPQACLRTEFDLLVEIASAAQLRALQPDFAKLATCGARGVIVTSVSDDPAYDFLSRFFAPAAGVSEDPVTGSAHCALAPFWSERLGRQRMTGYQASQRGGVVEVELAGDRVLLRGWAVTVLRGELLAPQVGR